MQDFPRGLSYMIEFNGEHVFPDISLCRSGLCGMMEETLGLWEWVS